MSDDHDLMSFGDAIFEGLRVRQRRAPAAAWTEADAINALRASPRAHMDPVIAAAQYRIQHGDDPLRVLCEGLLMLSEENARLLPFAVRAAEAAPLPPIKIVVPR